MATMLPRIDKLVDDQLSAQADACDDQTNPWLNARRRWNELFGTLASATKFLMRVAILSWALSFVLAAALITVAINPKFIPYVIEVDSQGAVLGAGVPEKKPPQDRSMVKELAEWVTNFRSVSRDPVVQRRWIDKVYAYLIESSQAAKAVTEWYSASDPFDRGSKYLVSIEVESVLQLSARTWQVDWSEKIADSSSEPQPPRRYRAVITTKFFEIKNEEAIPRNPFGLFISDLSITPIGI